MFYSPSNNAFYDAPENYNPAPADLVEITANEHAALLAGQAAGNTIAAGAGGFPELYDPEPAAPYVPTSVTMRQARLALLAAGKLSAISAAMADAPEAVRIDWEFAATVDRNSPTVAAMAAVLNLTAGDLDGLFTEASKL